MPAPTSRYAEIVNEIRSTSVSTERITLVAELKAEREAVDGKPDYAALLELFYLETDPDVKQKLQEEAYTFTQELTDEEKAVFSYLPADYLENNPGYNEEGEWISYIGSYPNPDTGEYS
jgi:hypothetical protein